ncbi:hypothetical protein [Puia sp.]|jgi:hypothetical protein
MSNIDFEDVKEDWQSYPPARTKKLNQFMLKMRRCGAMQMMSALQ